MFRVNRMRGLTAALVVALLTTTALAACIGDRATGPTADSVTLSPPSRLATGGLTTCYLTPGGLPLCWTGVEEGHPVDLHVPGNGDLRLETLHGSATHVCGVARDGGAWCWGPNLHGEMGDGTTVRRFTPLLAQPGTLTTRNPTLVTGGHRFVRLAVAAYSTCGVDTQLRAWCWGRGSLGALGTGVAPASVPQPVAVSTGARFVELSADDTVCGRTVANTVLCWGILGGTLYPGSFPRYPGDCRAEYYPRWVGEGCRTPTPLAGNPQFTSLSHARCGLTDAHRVYCWGADSHGQLGTGSVGGHAFAPVSPLTEQRFREVASGGGYTCALTLDDAAWCWGAQTAGNLGDGVGGPGLTPIGRGVPEPVPTSLRFRTLSAGVHTCGITLDAELWCWGPGYGNRPVQVILPAFD